MSKEKNKLFLILTLFIFMISGCTNELKNIENLNDLTGASVGIYTGSEYDNIADDKIVGVKTLYFNSYSDQIIALKSGKIDGFLTDKPLANEIINKNHDLKILDDKLTDDSYAFAINPSKKELKLKIDEVLTEMEKDGTLNQMENKWMGNNEDIKELNDYNFSNKNGTIKFATVSGSAPFSYIKNNKIVGYEIEVISYICEKLEFNLEIIEMSFEGIIPALKSGKVDVAGCSIIVTEERKKSVLFSTPDYTGGIVVVVRK